MTEKITLYFIGGKQITFEADPEQVKEKLSGGGIISFTDAPHAINADNFTIMEVRD